MYPEAFAYLPPAFGLSARVGRGYTVHYLSSMYRIRTLVPTVLPSSPALYDIMPLGPLSRTIAHIMAKVTVGALLMGLPF